MCSVWTSCARSTCKFETYKSCVMVPCDLQMICTKDPHDSLQNEVNSRLESLQYFWKRLQLTLQLVNEIISVLTSERYTYLWVWFLYYPNALNNLSYIPINFRIYLGTLSLRRGKTTSNCLKPLFINALLTPKCFTERRMYPIVKVSRAPQSPRRTGKTQLFLEAFLSENRVTTNSFRLP